MARDSGVIRNVDGDTPIELAKLLDETEIYRFLDNLSASL